MHLAHQELFKKLGSNGAIVVICTGYANLTAKTHRTRHTHFPLVYYPLENIKHLSGTEFISLLKEEFPNLQKIVVGYDFHFGHKALQNSEDLKKIFEGDVVVVDEFAIDGQAVHSRIIRGFLRDGDMEKANQFLGYRYMLQGYYTKGQGLGKKEFVPTINIEVTEFLLPKEGIYATKTTICDQVYDSVTFVGKRLSTDGNFACETHLLVDQEYRKDNLHLVSIEFYTKIRDNKKFDEYQELKEQILKDIEMVKKYFAKGKNNG